jgi:uncharacterized protein
MLTCQALSPDSRRLIPRRCVGRLSIVPKPKKQRYVDQPPSVAFFKPQGIPLFQLEQVVLAVEEFEAIRLVDYEGMHLEEAAQRLKVSRATCARVLDSAHKKVGTALTHGHAIRIDGGSFVLGRNRFRCRECGSRWEIEIGEETVAEEPMACPKCRSDHVVDLAKEVGYGGGHHGASQSAPGGPRGQGGGRGPGGQRWRGGRGGR